MQPADTGRELNTEDNMPANTSGFNAFVDQWQENAQLALDTIALRPTRGIPAWMLNDMQWSHLEMLSGNPPGSYAKDPVRVYREFSLKSGACFIDQWIPENPLSMKDQGYDQNTERGATTGAEEIVRESLQTAADICIYTNDHIVIETL